MYKFVWVKIPILVLLSEYQLETETLSQCEQLRTVSAAQEHEHVPQCSEDGRFRCSSFTNISVYTVYIIHVNNKKVSWVKHELC